jgi:hypothetical protein
LALERIVETCSAVVLVDSDDILHSSRVMAAKTALEDAGLAGCALRLVDEKGQDLHRAFDLPTLFAPEDVLPRNNVFGFSNSAYRSELLRRCLPIPADTVLVDWFLATRAWLLGARLAFDSEPRMYYRQHSTNIARVTPPFSREQVIADTALVRRHFQLLLVDATSGYIRERHLELKRVAAEINEFESLVVNCPAKLDVYVEALNDLQPPLIWWSCVAFPKLGHMWKR